MTKKKGILKSGSDNIYDENSSEQGIEKQTFF